MELIAALIHKPKVIFLDEPTIGLDIISQKKIREFLKYYNQKAKTTILLTSHYMNDIEDMCSRSIIINQGRLVYDGELSKVNELFNQKKIIKLQLQNEVRESYLRTLGELKEFTGSAATLEVDKTELKGRLKTILDSDLILDYTVEDVPLEEGISLIYQKGGVDDGLPEKVH